MHSSSKPEAAERPLYEEIAKQFGPALSRLAAAYEAHAERRRDLLQDIHFAIWRSLTTFDGRCSIRTWIYRVAHNTGSTYIARHRRQGGQPLYSLDELSEMPGSHDAENITDREQALDHLRRLIARLQLPDRQIMLLYLEDLDAASIASIVGCTPGNVATKIHRIKALLTRRFHAREIQDA